MFCAGINVANKMFFPKLRKSKIEFNEKKEIDALFAFL